MYQHAKLARQMSVVVAAMGLGMVAAPAWAQDVTTGDAVAGPTGDEAAQQNVNVDWTAADGDPVGGNWVGLVIGGDNVITSLTTPMGFLTLLEDGTVNRVLVPDATIAESLNNANATISLQGGADVEHDLDDLGFYDGVLIEVFGTVNSFGADPTAAAIELDRATTATWNLVRVLDGGAVVGTVTSAAASLDLIEVNARTTTLVAETSSITGAVNLGGAPDDLVMQAYGGSGLGLATSLIDGDVNMGAAGNSYDYVSMSATGNAIARITGTLTFGDDGDLYLEAMGLSGETALVEILGAVTFGAGDDFVWIDADGEAGTTASRVHLASGLDLGSGTNYLYIFGNNEAFSTIAFNNNADGSGANQTVLGGTGTDLVYIAGASSMFGDFDFATADGGSDTLWLSGSTLTGTVAFGSGGSFLTGDGTSRVTGVVTTVGPLTINGNGTLTFNSAVDVGAGATLTLSNASSLTFDGGITNTAGTGNLRIVNGIIDTTATALADTFAVTIDSPARLNLGAADTFRGLSGAGNYDANGFDTTLTTGTSAFTGTLTDAGDFTFSGGTHTFTGDFAIGETVNDAEGLAVSDGTVALIGNNSITGQTNITGGSLELNGNNATAGPINLTAGTLLTTGGGIGNATVVMSPGATVGAATSAGLTLDATGNLDLSAVDANGERVTLNISRGNTIIQNWTLPAAGGAVFEVASTGTTGNAVLQDLALDGGGSAETLRVAAGTVRLLDSVTLGVGDAVDAAVGARLILDAPEPVNGTVGPGAGQLFWGPGANLGSYSLDSTHGLASGLDSGHDVTVNVDVNGNTAFIGGNTIDIQGNLDMTSTPSVFTVDPATTLMVSGPIANAADLTKAGAGNLVLDAPLGANLIVTGGTADLGALVSGNVTANTGTTVRLDGDNVGGNLAVTQATVTALSDSTVAGGLTAQTMTVGDSMSRLTITGPANFASPNLNVLGNAEFELGGNITGNIYKSGPGTLYINDLDNDGQAALGTVYAIEGTLKGDGPIAGTLWVLTNAAHAPGGSVGDPVQVAGDYLLDGVLEIDVDKTDPRIHDKVVANGAVDLDGGTIRISAASADQLRQYDRYTIIVADADNTGDLLTVGTVDVQDMVAFIVDGEQVDNTYVLEVFRQPLTRLATTPNEAAIARAIDQMYDNDLTDALGVLPTDQFSNAIRQLSPEAFVAAPAAVSGVVSQINGQIAGQLMSRRAGLTRSWADQGWAGLPALSLQFAQAVQDPWWTPRDAFTPNPRTEPEPEPGTWRDFSSPEQETIAMDQRQRRERGESDWGGFVKGYGLFQDRDTTPDLLGFDSSTYGGTGGIEREISDDTVLGLLFGYGYTDQEYNDGRGDAEVHSLRVGPYVGVSSGALFLDASLTAGYHMAEASRVISIGGFTETAEADFDAWDVSFYVGTGVDMVLGPVVVTPTAALQYVYYSQQSFEETGAGPANLSMDSWSNDSLTTTLGARFSRVFDIGEGGVLLAPEAFVGWSHEFLEPDSMNGSFNTLAAGSGTAFVFQPAEGDQDRFVFGAGIAALLKNNTSVFARYDGATGDDLTAHAISAGVAFRF